MCGIAGYISLNNSIKKAELIQASCVIQYRGPDAEGSYFSEDEKIGLAHRRLSILDLSSSANQPMFSANRRYTIIYNGEVYNFKKIREKLADRGVSLKTTSDTEVILELFAQYGTECFKWLNGMFAFAIYDTVKKNLTLCRDHAGIKPLFIYHDETDLIFSSEIKLIKALRGDKLSINTSAIPYFLHLGFIPQPFTIYNQVEKFPAAHYLQIDTTQINFNDIPSQIKPFWNLESKIEMEPVKNEAEAKKTLSYLVYDSVEKQLVSDVPIGTFLSGGVDSSLVTAVASKVSAQKVNTYSIAIDDGKYNESKYATQVASHLNTAHHEFHVKEKQVLNLINELLPAYDEPFADSSAFPTMMVSKLARQHVKVALSGDGGDELFMGYGMYLWAKRLSNPLMPLIRWPLFGASKLMNNKYQRAGNLYAYPSKQNIITHIFSQEQYFFREQELEDLLVNKQFSFDGINNPAELKRKLSNEENQALWDFNYYLKDDLLVKIDRASMRYSLETRVPLLDFRIVEFAFNLSADLKIKNGTMKYLLKEMLYDHLPKQIFARKKWGFSIPLVKWLKTDLKYLVDKYTSEEVITKYNILHYAEVKKIREQYFKGKDYLFNRLWVIIVLHWWLEEN
ncbi:MAG: asnB [Chitinophagaceae bacterium]|nr:asnB [Chitinophagaceae bacterium]